MKITRRCEKWKSWWLLWAENCISNLMMFMKCLIYRPRKDNNKTTTTTWANLSALRLNAERWNSKQSEVWNEISSRAIRVIINRSKLNNLTITPGVNWKFEFTLNEIKLHNINSIHFHSIHMFIASVRKLRNLFVQNWVIKNWNWENLYTRSWNLVWRKPNERRWSGKTSKENQKLSVK